MSPKTCNPLLDTLAKLGTSYPDMRFGQLIEMIALLAGEEAPLSPVEIDDDRLFETAVNHLRIRRQHLKTEDGPEPGGPRPEARAELLNLLRRVRDRRPDWPLGHLAEHLAITAGSGLYDAEDEQLITAARSLALGPPG